MLTRAVFSCRLQLRACFNKRNARKAERFKLEICRCYRRRELLFLGETSKDGRSLRRWLACGR